MPVVAWTEVNRSGHCDMCLLLFGQKWTRCHMPVVAWTEVDTVKYAYCYLDINGQKWTEVDPVKYACCCSLTVSFSLHV